MSQNSDFMFEDDSIYPNGKEEEDGWEVVKPRTKLVVAKPAAFTAERPQLPKQPSNSNISMEEGEVVKPHASEDELQDSTDCLEVECLGTIGCHIVKRNLKTVALMLFFGVFCVHAIPRPAWLQQNRDSLSLLEGHEYLEVLHHMQEKILELEAELSTVVAERNQFLTASELCENDLQEVTSLYDDLNSKVKVTKWPATLAFVTAPTPRMIPVPAPSRRIPEPYPVILEQEPMPSPTLPAEPTYKALMIAPSMALTVA